MNVRRLIPTAAVAGAAALGLTALTACSSSDASDHKSGGDRLDVVASFYPMQFLAERIGGGDHVSVSSLTKPGVEPPRPGAQPPADRRPQRRRLHPLPQGHPARRRRRDQAVGVPQHPRRHDADHAGGPRHGGRRRGTRPRRARPRARGRGGRCRPAHLAGPGEVHRGRQGRRQGAGEDRPGPRRGLPQEHRHAGQGAGRARHRVPDRAEEHRDEDVHHHALRLRVPRRALRSHPGGIAGIDPEAEPSPARISALHSVAEKEKVTTVFFETLASDKTAKTVARDTGLRTDVLDPLEGITKTSKGDDYIEVMKSNLAALRTALGAK